LQYADLSPDVAAKVGNQMVELAAQAREGQVVRVNIAVGGAVGVELLPFVMAELREQVEDG
jgi:hypothetical protein